MTEPSPLTQYHVRTFEPDPPPDLTDLMSEEQARQFIELLKGLLNSNEGKGKIGVLTIVIKNHHVRALQGGFMEDFAKI